MRDLALEQKKSRSRSLSLRAGDGTVAARQPLASSRNHIARQEEGFGLLFSVGIYTYITVQALPVEAPLRVTVPAENR